MNTTHFNRRHWLTAAAFAGTCPAAAFARAFTRPSSQALPLPLALEAAPDIDPAGYLVSEKLDGVRALWDGQRLRFRSGLPVAAPAWFTQRLPATPLDGELWLGRGRFEVLSGTVRRAVPSDAQWRAVRYMVFEQPGGAGSFAQRAARLAAIVQQADWPALQAVPQETVPNRAALQQRLHEVLRAGGEGLVLHRADTAYQTGRSGVLFKLKPLHDAEAQVIGHQPGRGKHAGRLGALKVRTAQGVEFMIGTGFSDAQRERPPALGTIITFSHRGITTAGVPRFASFLRERSL